MSFDALIAHFFIALNNLPLSGFTTVYPLTFPGGSEVKVSARAGSEDPLEKEMATDSSTLGWRIPWREEPGRLQSMGSQRVGHD